MKALKTTDQQPREAVAPRAKPQVRVAGDGDRATQSQAALLQSYLETEFTDSSTGGRRLPLAVSLPIIAAVSGGLWFGIIAGVRALLH